MAEQILNSIFIGMMHLLYIDPGSSSYFVQVVIAAILGVALYFKTLKLRIKAFFTRKKVKD